MYTVFLQALGKYLDVKSAEGAYDGSWQYARSSLVHYAEWMEHNEELYLNTPEKLEYPNETWAAQDLRKCNVLLFADKYSWRENKGGFFKKAEYFYNQSLEQLNLLPTKELTRPIVLLMQNGEMFSFFKSGQDQLGREKDLNHLGSKQVSSLDYPKNRAHFFLKRLKSFSLKNELSFLKGQFFK